MPTAHRKRTAKSNVTTFNKLNVGLLLLSGFVWAYTSLFIQLGEYVSKSSGVVDPFDDAALLIERNHSVGADVQLPPP